MPITFSRYVDITSAVGGAAQATARELILRLMTTSVEVPTESVVEFDTLDGVSAYFGTTSAEYLQAQSYFSFISKLATTPSKISFARYSLVDTAPTILGDGTLTYVVSDFDTIADATFTLTLGAIEEDIVVDFTGPAVVSLTEVASRVEAAIQAANIAAIFASATVAYDATDGRFEFTGGATGAAVISAVATGSGTPLLPIIGWVDPPAKFSDGIDATSLTTFLIAQAQLTNNFGSFSFITDLTADQILEVATWNDSENVKYIFLQKVAAADTQTTYDAINLLGGTALTLYDASLTTDFPWLLPGAILAATPYTKRNSVQNYMFQQHSLASLVDDTTLSGTYDDIRVNYYGETQQAGSLLAFYQRGFLMGIATDPIDIGVYGNEAFLKDSIGVAIINLLLAVTAVPANATGVAQVLAAIQAPIDLGLFNGIISVGKTLNQTQRAFVTTITGDETSYHQIENSGYWIEAQILEPVPTEFEVNYTLLYSKNDVVRKVEGSHLLI